MVKLNIPKKIHLTCKDKNNIDNPVWKKCLDKYKSMYSDEEINLVKEIYNDDIGLYKSLFGEKNLLF